MDTSKLVLQALLKLKELSQSITTEAQYCEIKKKYNIMLLGDKFNNIYSSDVLKFIKIFSNEDLTMSDISSKIPDACKTLGMKYEAMQYLGNPNAPNNHLISLY